MMAIEFVRNSSEDVKMTGWELVSYTSTKIEI